MQSEGFGRSIPIRDDLAKAENCARDDRFMVSNVLRNRFISASEIRSQLKEVRTVSLRTVRRRLVKRNLKDFRPVRTPQLLPQNRRELLRFARDHADWTMHQWSNVLFSDETRISSIYPDGNH